ncbi:transcription factor AP-4 [Pectinophora gossypiella]|uniref:BHLH domain-containing protein n=1 Tax=Pectinophora gossypiella TaxID=13191 RepID=A0A1E1WRW4_PECGO|nr:transcription factor AP-4 [Pectinophora gossypiella]
MSLHGNDVCLLEVEDYNLYEEEASDHAFSRNEKHSGSGSKTMEAEKRIRREIANSNERRRMQSINAGFQALRTLLPRHEGEKLSKAAILQQTAEYIYSLEQEKTRLLSQNCQLKRLLNQHEGGEVPLKKRKNDILSHVPSVIPPDSTDDTITNSRSPEPVAVITVTSVSQKKEAEGGELRSQLDRERRLRRLLEERLHALEGQIYPDTNHSTRFEQTDSTECKVETETIEELPVEVPPAPAPIAPPPARVTHPAPPAPSAPLLEAAIKAEPRVEVEVLPDAAHETPSRLYLASTSRQNLETIVEAIRHLEGDHLFREEAGDAPLALTKKVERAPPSRPGVIVVKHS